MFLRANAARVVFRQNSSVADKLRRTTGNNNRDTLPENAQEGLDNEALTEPFNEPYLIPKRKLRGQMQIEHATGRTVAMKRNRFELLDRIAVRSDRSKEISPESEWSDVWPAAKTFNASVVPLPIRMGSRRDPDKRAPFKKHGNLELVKVPNFLHLTPPAIQKHCEAIKKFCTEYPKELVDNKNTLEEQFPVTISYNSYVHQGTNIRDNRARVVTLELKVASLGLSSTEKEKMIRLSGSRYNEESDVLTIITDRCHTRQQNLDYAHYLLTALYHESKKVEPWEKMKDRADYLKVDFDGSKCEDQLVSTLQKVLKVSEDSSLNSLGKDATKEDIVSHEKVRKFGVLYNKYRNEKETVDSTREYARQVRELLGVKAPINSSSSEA